MSKSINIVFLTSGWGGNELMALSIGRYLSLNGCCVKFYVRDEQMKHMASIDYPCEIFNDAIIDENSSLNIFVAPSFLSLLKNVGFDILRNNKNWFYSPFVGFEWSEGLVRFLKLILASLFFRFIDWRIICIRYEFLPTIFFPRSNLTVFPNVPSNFIDAKSRNNIGNELRLICVGRINFKQKQQDKLFHLLSNLIELNSLNDFKLIFIGSGDDYELLSKMTANQSWVELIPWCDPSQHFDGNCIVVLPSAFEGLPLVALEAIASSVPVIGTRESGISTLVSESCLFDMNSMSLLGVISHVRSNRWHEVEFSRTRVKGFYCSDSLNNNIANWLNNYCK
jgi:glycosyltransferase involved in cell wall biosynthesis